MNKTSEILENARILREKRQQDIDSNLQSAISQAVIDTKDFVMQRANSIERDMAQEIEQIQQSLKEDLQNKKIGLQKKIETVQTNLTKESQEMQQDLQIQIQNMQMSLQQLSELSQSNAAQAQIKKTLSLSIIPLASIALILLISSICFGYVNSAKLREINIQKEQEQRLDVAIQAKIEEYNKLTLKIYRMRNR